jgi:putative FmdB family regulatory protein
MPIYDFECESCGHNFDNLIRNDQDRLDLSCPECQSQKVRQMISLPAKPLAVGAVSTPCGEGPSCGAPWCQRGKALS